MFLRPCVRACVYVCVRAHLYVNVCVCAQVCGCGCGCCCGDANGCIPLTLLVGVCECCTLTFFRDSFFAVKRGE